ncbi:MAG: MarR family transcriptional regulator [Bacteroidota bacterium]|nr:MarR family transcriptional regulator [Bacteroidota bacterium]
MGNQDKPLGLVIGSMMHEMFRVLKKRVNEQSDVALTIEQFGLLYLTHKVEQEAIQKDMAEIMGKDKSSILRMVDSLENKELVRRVVDKDDRRKNRLMVTKKGEKTLEQWLEIEVELDNELMEGIDQSDLDSFYKVINHLEVKAEQL